MSEHVFDEFPSLLRGDADRATVSGVSVHLRECADCKDELVGAVIAHATLSSAAHHAPDVATGDQLRFVARRATSQVDVADRLAAAAVAEPGHPETAGRVDLGPVFEQIRREAQESSPTSLPPARSHPAAGRYRSRRLLAVAAAVVVLGGGGSALVASQVGSDGRKVTVGAFGAGRVNASAVVDTNGSIRIDASKLPALPADKYYEVWLVNSTATGLLPLGPLGGDRTGTYSVPAPVMETYAAIQVTVQDNDGTVTPSKTSVLRGTYNA